MQDKKKEPAKEKNYWTQIALFACVYYTVAVLFLLAVFALFQMNTEGIPPIKLFAILPFALLFSAANTMYRHTELAKWARLLLHYLMTVGGAFLFLFLPNSPEDSNSVIIFFLFTAFYWLIMGIILFFSARIHRVKRDSSQYQSVYRK